MMQKIVAFSVDDLRLDSQTVADALGRACGRREKTMFVNGMCQIQETVYFTLLPCGDRRKPPCQYVWVENEDCTDAGVTALLEERWAAGFDLIGSADGGDGLAFLLFARNAEG